MTQLIDLLEVHVGRLKPLPGEQSEVAREVLKRAKGIKEGRFMDNVERDMVSAAVERILVLVDLFDESPEGGTMFYEAIDALNEAVRCSEPPPKKGKDPEDSTGEDDLGPRFPTEEVFDLIDDN